MRVLICGSRTFSDRGPIIDAIERLIVRYGTELVVIQGGAKGADDIAEEIASKLDVDTVEYKADWDKYGKRAGFLRNTRMLVEGKPDLVLAFKDKEHSVGTDMMVKIARDAGVPTYVYTVGCLSDS